jgi:hypothetical protein
LKRRSLKPSPVSTELARQMTDNLDVLQAQHANTMVSVDGYTAHVKDRITKESNLQGALNAAKEKYAQACQNRDALQNQVNKLVSNRSTYQKLLNHANNVFLVEDTLIQVTQIFTSDDFRRQN